jgi:hypothetical protein
MDQVQISHIFDASILRAGYIRGLVGETLGETDAEVFGLSVGTLVQREGGRCVAVARDGRLSSPALVCALVDGLLASGCTVVNVGLGPTPCSALLFTMSWLMLVSWSRAVIILQRGTVLGLSAATARP